MPFLRADAPANVPDCETLEYLLGERNGADDITKTTRTLQQLSLQERSKTGLLCLGKRTVDIDGDPYAILPVWAGNVGHPHDERMFEIIEPLLKQLDQYVVDSTVIERTAQLQSLLGSVRNSPIESLATDFSDDGKYSTTHEYAKECTVYFKMGSLSVRIIQLNDVDKSVPASYKQSMRVKGSEKAVRDAFQEAPMPVATQKYAMAIKMEAMEKKVPEEKSHQNKFLEHLRATVQEHYWTKLSSADRDELIITATSGTAETLKPYLEDLEAHWPKRWNNSYYDRDYYHQYTRDTSVADSVWTTIEEDVFIVIDRNRETIFASVQNLSQHLFGQAATDLLARVIDLWSWFTPLASPESQRHVVDNYIRKLHPELDMSKATLGQLANAKMCMVHYGTWAPMPGDKSGRSVKRTGDTLFKRTFTDVGHCEDLFPDFYKSVMGITGRIIRFLMERLDPSHFQECRDIFSNLEDDRRVPHAEEADANFLTMFALGINPYTQRHVDGNDVAGGLAGLVTVGSYSGK